VIYILIYSCGCVCLKVFLKRLRVSGSILIYLSFKELASKNGYTVTETFEKFMSRSLEFGLAFPSAAKTENVEAEARIMLAWLKDGQFWVSLGGEEDTSTRGRLLEFLPNVEDAGLRLDIEETLKKKP
jgi:hypothetical protein